jgi:S-adenosylmethionine decarboxylase proenzyme
MKPLGSQLIAEFMNCAADVLNDKEALGRILATGIKRCGLTLISIDGHQFEPIGLTMIAIIGESHVVVHTYPEARHASIDIFTCSNGSHAKNDLLTFFKSQLKPGTVRVVSLDRGNPLAVREKDWITSFSSIGYETRYHIKNWIHSGRSEFQQIDIIENDDFGRMLFLDKDLQIAEKDAHIYNHSLVLPLENKSRSPKRVAILGGGDGGVLSEVLKYGPESVDLVDIDEDVILSSRQHLPSVCGGAFDHPHVNVHIDDANVFLKTHGGFDAIIYDLTMYPEALTNTGRRTFLREVFSSISASLADEGTVSMQCCSEHDHDTLDLLGSILKERFDDIVFEKRFIPSFCEEWVFASAVVKKRAILERARQAGREGSGKATARSTTSV